MKKNILPAIIYLILVYFFSGCSVKSDNKIANHYNPLGRETLYQVSTLNAVLAGSYDGAKTFAELKEQGDFGIGLIHALDGEMIALDGKFYQLNVDGTAQPLSDQIKTPFAVVTFFDTDESLSIEDGPISFSFTQKTIDALRTNKKFFYAIRIEGEFEFVRTRSFVEQEKPYPKLTEVLRKKQPFQLFENVKGIIVGFWFPRYMGGIRIFGYHFHFITEDRTRGGHVLNFKLVKGKIEIDRTPKIYVEIVPPKEFN
ncbi:MAG: acetolactate decarboxylase [Candidatus Aminicenantes bacterium]|nr:MAG: acetolactate decarboxylase [Candidatus Aminicenantes bacterium]